MISFAVVNDVAVVCGDLICSDDDAPIFLAEFMGFCKENNYSIFLLDVTEKFLKLYKTMGFDSTKYGEDAYFFLEAYNLKGGKAAKVRAPINHANKAGITVSEYKPKQQRDFEIEKEIKMCQGSGLPQKKAVNFPS